MSVEAKVGAFAMGGIILLSAAIFMLGNFHFGSDDDIIFYAGFKQVLGIDEKSEVRFSGVPVGRVTAVTNDSGMVTVTMRVPEDTKIPKDSKVTMAGIGVMGEKFINILPGTDNGEYVETGDYLVGVDEVGMDSMFENMNEVMEKVETLLESVHDIVGNETFKTSVVDMSKNLKDASAHMNGLMESLEKMAVGNEGNINQIVSQLNEVMRSANVTMQNVEHMTANIDKFAGDPATVEDLKLTLQNVAAISKNVASMAENMNKVAGDPQVAEDLKDTIHNAKNLTERADKILGKFQKTGDKLSSIKVTPSVEMLYSGKRSNWDAAMNLDVTAGDTSLTIGAEHIGDGTKFNAQVGKKFNDLGVRGGIIAGKAGVALDAYAGSRWKFSAEVYDPNDAKVRLKSRYRIAESTYLLGEWHDVNHKESRAAYFGLRQEF